MPLSVLHVPLGLEFLDGFYVVQTRHVIWTLASLPLHLQTTLVFKPIHFQILINRIIVVDGGLRDRWFRRGWRDVHGGGTRGWCDGGDVGERRATEVRERQVREEIDGVVGQEEDRD